MPFAEKIAALAIIAMIAWAYWRASRPRLAFKVRIVDGQPAAIEGKVTRAFLTRLRDAAADHGIARAEIAGYEHEGTIRLKFSRQTPMEARQQIRNWWAMYGRAAPQRYPDSRCG